MGKDRIDERLANLERELKSLKSAQVQGVESIITELKRFQEMMLEEKVAEIRKELSRESRDAVLDSYLEDASVRLDESLPDPCPRDMKKTCKYIFQKRLEDAAQKLKGVEGGDITETAVAIASDDEERIGRLKTLSTCARCYGMYGKEKDSLVKVMEMLSSYRNDIASRVVDDYLRALPDDLVVSTILDPLSHKACFRMLKSLSVGSMSYKELTEATGYEGGHLIYHLNKLADADLAAKSESSGRYAITEKGIGVMDLVKSLYYK
jgi:DNA-binding transcriptional ArsR family regulator